MSLEGQRLQLDRYHLIPRTLSFLLKGDEILLLRLGESKAGWKGKLNGIGGHIERGENPRASAQREIHEETGIQVEVLRLVGAVAVDVHELAGIGLFVYVGETQAAGLSGSGEGNPVWIQLATLSDYELVEDLPALLPRALRAFRGEDPPFSGLYTYDVKDGLQMQFLT
jgi:8-oxo-dGTP diphosphatase